MIELTGEMREAFYADGDERCDIPGCVDCFDDRLAAVLAIVQRDQRRASDVLMDAAAVARGIADRLAVKPGDGKRWTAMSAGARLVAVRLTELADAEEAP